MVQKVETNALADGALANSATGRAKMADGFLSADAAGRAKMADGFADYTKVANGAVIQVANLLTGAVATGTTVVPLDDTIPQNTEGDEYMTLAFTPLSATSKLKIEVDLNAASTAGGAFTVALFKDTAADAIAAAFNGIPSGGNPVNVKFTHWMTAGSTSAMTFKVRAGLNGANTTTFNGSASARRFGGVMASSITITEIKA